MRDWLAAPTQVLAEVTGRAVYHDGIGELSSLRKRLAWYPDDVWRFVPARQWTRIAQEEPFVGPAAEAGDDLGSRVAAARLAREMTRLCLLLARRYPPHGKWLGRAFGQVPQAAGIAVALPAALAADEPAPRQDALRDAYEAVGRWQNALRPADAVDARRRPFHDQPSPVSARNGSPPR